MGREEQIRQRIGEHIQVQQSLLDDATAIGTISEIAEALVQAYRNNRKILLFGNGGSAADAQHIAAELVGTFYNRSRRALPAEALTVNSSSLTAIGNDYDFTTIFARQVEALGQEGDVAIGISTSGNSENVIKALRVAEGKGLVKVGFTGKGGGKVKEVVDYCVRIPSEDTPRIQEAHILVGHILCDIVERELFNAGSQ